MHNAPWFSVITRALQLLVLHWRLVSPDRDRCVWSRRTNARLRKAHWITLCSVFVSMVLFGQSSVWGQVLDGSAVRAAHIFNFGKYIEWPATGDTAHLKVCAPDNSPVTKVLNGAQGKKAQGREVQIVAYGVSALEATVNSAECNILYVAECEEFCGKIVEKLKNKPVLVVSERKEVGSVRFVDVSSKVKFAIDKAALDGAKLKMSSQVLDLAVKDE